MIGIRALLAGETRPGGAGQRISHHFRGLTIGASHFADGLLGEDGGDSGPGALERGGVSGSCQTQTIAKSEAGR